MASRFRQLRQILGRVHSDLVLRWHWYRQWHNHPQRHLHHKRIALSAGIGGLVTIAIATIKYLIIVGLISSISLNPLSALAASQSWTSQADWGSWTLSNTTAADNPGSVQLSTTGGGASWADDAAAPTENYLALFAADASNVWFGISDTNYLEYYNGSSYANQGTLGTPSAKALWGSSVSDVWAISGSVPTPTYHYNGSSWSLNATPLEVINDIHGISSSDIWAAANNGTMYHYNGSVWSQSSPSPKPGAPFNAVFGFASNDFWAGGSTGILRHWTGASWTSPASSVSGNITGIWGTSSNDLWLRSGSLFHTTNGGSSWSTDTAPTDNSCTESGNVWGSSTSDIWTPCKAGFVLHYNGSAWSTVATPAGAITRLYGTSSTNIWGTAGTDIYHYTGSTVYQSSGTASITYTPAAGQFNDWTSATPTTTTPTNTTATVEYSHDNATWVASLGSVPSSESLYVRVTLATTDTSVTPTLDALTVNYDAITTTVSSPNGGENIQFNETGDTTPITWTATGTAGVDHIHLQYSTNSGGAWSDVPGATALAATDVTYPWNMPDASSSTVRVKVILEDSSNAELDSDTSNADFTITYDTTLPTFSSVSGTSNNADTTRGKSGNVVTVTFTASESLASNPTVTLGTKAMTFSSVVGLNYTYTRTLDGTETEGSAAIAISGTDNAGNVGTGSGSFTTDFTNPTFSSISATSNNTTPTIAKSGNIVTLTFTASETLLANPTVTIGTKAMTFSSVVGLDYTYTRTLDGTETAGASVIAISGSDLTSNAGTGSGSFTLDFTNPTISIASPSSTGTYTTGASSIAVSGTASDNNTLSTVTSNFAGAVTGTGSWSQTVSLSVGANTVIYTATDSAGNTNTATIVITRTDNAGPGFNFIAGTSNNGNTSVAKVGNIVTITFTASEALLGNPTVTLGGQAATYVSNVGLDYTYTRTITGTEAEGSATIAVSGLDLDSNPGSGSGSFTLDFTAPTFSSVSGTSNGAGSSRGKVGDIITITFTASEALSANPTVTLGGQAATYSTNSGLNYTYTRTLTGTETEGSAAIAISANDTASNAGTGSGSFTTDFTNPTFSSVAASSNNTDPSISNVGNIISITFAASETMGSNPTVTLGGQAATYSTTSGLNYTYTRTLTGTESTGSVAIAISGSDSAGNAGTGSGSFTITRDTSKPAAPTTFDVTSCNTSSCSLAWGQSSAADRAGYLLVARTDNNFTAPTGGTNYSISANQNLGGVSYTWIDNGNTTTGSLSSLNQNTLYYFAIYTVDTAYNYSDSKTTSGTTTSDTITQTVTKPDPVQDLTAFISSSSIRLNYRALPSGIIADIYRSAQDEERGNKLTATTTNSYEDTTAQKGIAYYYTVIARRTSDNGESDERQVTGTINTRFSIAIAVAPEVITARPGEQIQLKVTTYNSNGTTTALPHRFEVEPSVGSVNGHDVFTAGPAGDYPTGLKAIVEDGSSYSEVIVPVYIGDNNYIVGMGLSPNSRTLKTGESWTPSLIASNQNGTKYDGRNLGYQIKWQATGGSINNNGTYTAGNNTGEFEITGTATKSNEQWLIRGFVTISNEALQLEKVIMTNSLRIPPDTTGRFYTYGYDQFDNIMATYGPGGKHIFSNNDPTAGVIDPAGIFHAKQPGQCSEWNIRSDHYAGSRHLYIMGHVDTRSRSNEQVVANDNFRRVGLSSYSLTVKPGAIQQYSGRVINGWNQIVTNEQVIFSLGSNGTSEAGTITENGYFVAGNREGVYANVVKIKSRHTKTGVIKNLGSVTLLITPEDQTVSAIATASPTARPYTFAFSNAWAYNQFGATFQGRKIAVRPSIVNGGGVTESPWMMEVGGSGTYSNTIKGTQFVGGSLESATARQGSLFIKNGFSLCSLTGGGDDGGYIDDDGNEIIFIDSPNLYLPDSRLDRLIKESQRKGGGDTGDQIIPINRVRQISPWQRFITNPITQKVASWVAAIATLLTALLALSSLWELLSRLISWLTNGLHSLAFWKRDQANIGRVIDNRSKRPVLQATVTLINAQNKAVIGTQTTDSFGRYQFMVETGQAYIVKVEHQRYDSQQVVLWNNPHRVFRLGQKIEFSETRLVGRRRLTKLLNWLDNIRLVLLIAGTVSTYILGVAGLTPMVKFLIGYYIFAWMLEAYIRTKPRPFGVVTDAETKQPLDLVVVRIFTFADKLVRTIVTDQQGRFRTLMAPAYYKLTFTKVGWQPLTQHKYIGRSVQFLHIDATLTKNPAAPTVSATGPDLGPPPVPPVPPGSPPVTPPASTGPVQTEPAEQQHTGHDPQVDLTDSKGTLLVGKDGVETTFPQPVDHQTAQPEGNEQPTDNRQEASNHG